MRLPTATDSLNEHRSSILMHVVGRLKKLNPSEKELTESLISYAMDLAQPEDLRNIEKLLNKKAKPGLLTQYLKDCIERQESFDLLTLFNLILTGKRGMTAEQLCCHCIQQKS